jgi:hypothetical protein
MLKDEQFIREFHSIIDWDNVYNLVLEPDTAARLTFQDRIMPVSKFISMFSASECINEKIAENLAYVASTKENMTAYMDIFGPKQTEETFQHHTINIDPHHFASLCCSQQYIPTTKPFIDILKRAYKGGDWVEFMVSCKPSFAFIEEHIVPGASKDAWLQFIEKHKRKRYSLEIRQSP